MASATYYLYNVKHKLGGATYDYMNLSLCRHYFEASQNIQKYHQLFQISQEKYDRLANLAGSGGAVSLKNGDVIDPSLVEVEFTRALQSESLSSGGTRNHHHS
jgi:hypothetical protein